MKYLICTYFLFLALTTHAQNFVGLKDHFTRQDTLRGSITAERSWWDVQRYDLVITPYYIEQSIVGSNAITYKVVDSVHVSEMQIDLQPPLKIDSVLLDGAVKISYTQEEKVWHLRMPKQELGDEHTITIYYSGKPTVAADPPGDGGVTWTKDSLGRPWVATSCQGIGASIWYPCKDHQSDEPDKGATISITVPDTLVAVSNGMFSKVYRVDDYTLTYKWEVVNPINNYGICFYVGKYMVLTEDYEGAKGPLSMSFWVLDYNHEKAKAHLIPNAVKTITCYEKWMGPYPFYEDGFKMVDAPYIGMEHQSAVAYGNRYKYGYRGKDISNTGWGMTYDILIVHEVAHEWFGNSITTADLADKWVHEGFAGYAEILYLNDTVGKEAANEYVIAKRKYIKNETPVIPAYGLNEMNGADDYSKGRAIVHMVRQVINDDRVFNDLLKNLNKEFYHKVTTSAELEKYISLTTGVDFSKFFDQYLRNPQLPVLEYKFHDGELSYRYTDCIKDFSMPIKVMLGKEQWITPTTKWQKISAKELANAQSLTVDPNFYLITKNVADE